MERVRWLRTMTRVARPELYEILEKKAGPKYEALKAAIREMNPKQELSLDDMTTVDSALEQTRVFPSEIYVNGKTTQLLHVEPLQHLTLSVKKQAYRSSMAEVMRTGALKSVPRDMVKDLAQQIGAAPVFNSNNLVDNIKAAGFDIPETIRDNVKELTQLAIKLKVDTGPTRREYQNSLQEFSPVDLTPDKVTTLRQFAKQMGGIDPNLAPVDLLREVQRRAIEKPLDLVEKIRKGIQKEGGDSTVFDHILKLSQDTPVYLTTAYSNPFYVATRFVSRLLGIAQTSARVTLHASQSMIEIPQMVGIKNYLSAIDTVVKDYRNVRDAQIALGAINDTHLAWGLEKGSVMEGIGRNLQQGFEVATGMRWVQEKNNAIAGEAFRRLAQQWEENGIPAERVNFAKNTLRLTDQQVAHIQKLPEGGTMDPQIFAKIVQNGVARTMFLTEATHNRGYLENHPILNMLFAYNSYALGTARATGAFMRDALSAVKSANPKAMVDMGWRAGLLLTGSIGAGMTSQILRNIYRGDVSHQDDETTLQKMGGALLQTHLLGPTQRILEASRYDQGSIDRLMTGMMPKVRALGDGLALLLNSTGVGEYGTFGKFPVSGQIKEAALQNAPLIKAFRNWSDNMAYPELATYRETRAATSLFMKNVLKEEPKPGQVQLNPEYHKVQEWVKRGDMEMAMKAATDYYEHAYQNFADSRDSDPDNPEFLIKKIGAIRSGLRQSLQNDSPIHINPMLVGPFLSTLPADKQDKYMESHAKYMAIVNAIAPKEEEER
jgi:hypothetical protein